MVIDEIVLAIDPALRKIEDILLWQNKFKTAAVFTFFHFLFWLFQNFNIRTYCTISCILLTLHLLDAYRTKKRREIIRLQKSADSTNVSSLGRYIIFIYSKLTLLWNELNKLKKKNRLHYFVLIFILWSMAGVIGFKIKGFYLSYVLFWIVFFVPAIIHYDLLRKLLRKAMPLLEQLDHSMKYERRSVLDKSELLVDVKLPSSDEMDEQEDEYLDSFKLDDLDKMKSKQRRVFENLQDDEDDDEEEELDMTEMDSLNDASGADGSSGGNKSPVSGFDYDVDDEEQQQRNESTVSVSRVYLNVPNQRQSVNNRNSLKNKKNFDNTTSDFDELSSYLPNESLPNIDDILDNTNNSYLFNIESGDKAIRQRKTKNRPSLLNYYGDMNTSSATSNSKRSTNEPDIDETFDFLDEELNK